MHLRNSGWNACLIAALATLSTIFISPPAVAENWSDASGKFTIQAEYAGIDGKNLVLLKPDGSKLSVPISKLSAESRAQAKAIYDRQKSGESASPAAGASMLPASSSSGLSRYQPAPRTLNFTPPTPPTISPMPAFPSNASLEQTLAYVRDQALAGHLEVFWHALPADMQAVADSPQLRDAMRPQIKENAETSNQIVSIVDKLTEVLVTKKQFILNSPMLAQVPPQFKPFIEQGFDPAVGLIHEYAEIGARTDAMMEAPMGDYVDYHFSRIGAHAQALLKIVPAEVRDPMVNSFVATQTSETEGTISFSKQDGTTQTVEMSRYNNRWLPKDLVTKWESDKESMIEDLVVSMTNNAMAANPQAKASMEAAVAQAGLMLDPLLAANSQQDFDTAVGQAMMPVMMMMGAMGGGAPMPGGPGAPGAPAESPPGF
jgi:SLA1 homology domain 1, SHD1